VIQRIFNASVLVLLIGACTSATVDTTTSSVTTTSTLPTTTTTNPPLVNGGLISVDPVTLIPLQGSDPILVADWLSPDGQFSAIQSLTTDSDILQMSLVDVASNNVLSTAEMPNGIWGDPIITDDGTVYWLSGDGGLALNQLGPGDAEAEVVYRNFPSGFSNAEFDLLSDGRFGVYGVVVEEFPEGVATLVLVEADGSSHTEISLENVIAGFANAPNPDVTVQVFEFVRNAPVWDEERNRFLLVEAARDVVTEVDLTTGEVKENPFSPPEAFLNQFWAFITPVARAKGPSAGTERVAVLTPDGQNLFVATLITETVVDEGAWEATSSPQDLMVLDVDTWEVSILDVAVDTLNESPDGTYLLAHGAEVTEGTTVGFESRPSPVYVIDMTTKEVLLGFQTSDEAAAEIQFSSGGELVYISTWSDDMVTIDILDLDLLQLTGAVSFRALSLVGPAGYMAFHLG